MTKTLTEQWRDNDLADDKLYYWRISDGQELVQNKLGMCAYRLCNDSDKIECLAPVPSYDKVKEMSQKIERLEFDNEVLDMSYSQAKEIIIKLEKQLDIATKALKKLTRDCNKWEIARKALKEMEGVE